MSTLHTVNSSPASSLLASCASVVRQGDGVLFIEDGIYHCVNAALLKNIPKGVALFVLKEDMLARGVLENKTESVELVDYDRFVELCCDFDKIVSWF